MRVLMICLGIESTAHTFGIGIVDDSGKILANEKSMYKPKIGSGIVPNEAADHHKKLSRQVLENALTNAKITMDDVDLVSYAAGPGIPPCLLVGADFATTLSKKYKKPLIPVNHCISHLEIGKMLTGAQDPVFVYLSGGNTQIIAFAEGRYRIFGETEDISVGNAFDMLARELKLPSPGGPEIERLALNGKYVELPYVVKGMDLSFSGIATNAIKKIKSVVLEDLCYSFQETCFAMITEVSERALAHTDKKEVLLVGGVAANKRLQKMMNDMCDERYAKMFVVPLEYAGDQAWAGILAERSKQKIIFKMNRINPNWRTDEVEVAWI